MRPFSAPICRDAASLNLEEANFLYSPARPRSSEAQRNTPSPRRRHGGGKRNAAVLRDGRRRWSLTVLTAFRSPAFLLPDGREALSWCRLSAEPPDMYSEQPTPLYEDNLAPKWDGERIFLDVNCSPSPPLTYGISSPIDLVWVEAESAALATYDTEKCRKRSMAAAAARRAGEMRSKEAASKAARNRAEREVLRLRREREQLEKQITEMKVKLDVERTGKRGKTRSQLQSPRKEQPPRSPEAPNAAGEQQQELVLRGGWNSRRQSEGEDGAGCRAASTFEGMANAGSRARRQKPQRPANGPRRITAAGPCATRSSSAVACLSTALLATGMLHETEPEPTCELGPGRAVAVEGSDAVLDVRNGAAVEVERCVASGGSSHGESDDGGQGGAASSSEVRLVEEPQGDDVSTRLGLQVQKAESGSAEGVNSACGELREGSSLPRRRLSDRDSEAAPVAGGPNGQHVVAGELAGDESRHGSEVAAADAAAASMTDTCSANAPLALSPRPALEMAGSAAESGEDSFDEYVLDKGVNRPPPSARESASQPSSDRMANNAGRSGVREALLRSIRMRAAEAAEAPRVAAAAATAAATVVAAGEGAADGAGQDYEDDAFASDDEAVAVATVTSFEQERVVEGHWQEAAIGKRKLLASSMSASDVSASMLAGEAFAPDVIAQLGAEHTERTSAEDASRGEYDYADDVFE